MGLFNKNKPEVKNPNDTLYKVSQNEHGVWIVEGTRFREATEAKAKLRREVLLRRLNG